MSKMENTFNWSAKEVGDVPTGDGVSKQEFDNYKKYVEQEVKGINQRADNLEDEKLNTTTFAEFQTQVNDTYATKEELASKQNKITFFGKEIKYKEVDITINKQQLESGKYFFTVVENAQFLNFLGSVVVDNNDYQVGIITQGSYTRFENKENNIVMKAFITINNNIKLKGIVIYTDR